MFYFNDQPCTPSFPNGLVKTESDFIIRSVETVLVMLTKLNVSEPEHWVTWWHRASVNLPFLWGKRIQYSGVSAKPHHVYLIFIWGNFIWKIENFCLLLKHFLTKLKEFSYQICSLIRNLTTYWGLMDNERNISVLNYWCF